MGCHRVQSFSHNKSSKRESYKALSTIFHFTPTLVRWNGTTFNPASISQIQPLLHPQNPLFCNPYPPPLHRNRSRKSGPSWRTWSRRQSGTCGSSPAPGLRVPWKPARGGGVKLEIYAKKARINFVGWKQMRVGGGGGWRTGSMKMYGVVLVVMGGVWNWKFMKLCWLTIKQTKPRPWFAWNNWEVWKRTGGGVKGRK